MRSLEEAAAHWREWFDRGEFDEGAACVEGALNAPGAGAPSVNRVRVLYGAHLLAFRRGEPSAAYAQECLDLARELGDVRGECDGLTGLAREALRAGDYPGVAAYAAEGLRKARASGDRAAEGPPLHLCAAGARLGGDYDRARELYLESVALGGEYYGPAGLFQYTGRPERVEPSAHAHDRGAQRELWRLSGQLTGITYRFLRRT